MKKINVVTLGCSKNTVDSEHLMARLAAAGYEVLWDSDRTDAKTVVINTCGFIGDAKQESIDMILRAAEAKKASSLLHSSMISFVPNPLCMKDRDSSSPASTPMVRLLYPISRSSLNCSAVFGVISVMRAKQPIDCTFG